jgi:TolB-like protein/predicted Ser/Thr protein kinase
MPLSPGARLGTYEIVGLIGAGGMGEVYRARDVRLGREVALKVLSQSRARDPEFIHRFQHEAQSASVLNHPNIVTIYGVGEEGDIAYIAMELVDGRTLREVLTTTRLRIEEVLSIAMQIADALTAAHAKGIVHRDLKPDNVMFTQEGLAKILDFGLAKRAEGMADILGADDQTIGAPVTQAGLILGTIGYMSPEQAGGRRADAASDQFSLGVILYEMLTGVRPFVGDTPIETLSAILRDEAPPLQTTDGPVNEPLASVVTRCLAKSPADRYPTTRQLATALRQVRDQWLAENPTVQESDEALTTKFRSGTVRRPRTQVQQPVTRRRALLITGAGVTAISLGGALAFRLWRKTGIQSIAVLPFVNAANDDTADYLCDGISESLIRRIARLSLVKVMARSTVFNFKGKTIDPLQAGRQLGVDAVMTGTVRRRSGNLVIGAELVDVASGVQLWGDSYDRPAADVQLVQDDIVNAIVEDGIRVKLTGQDRRQLSEHLARNPQAYELYLQARHELSADTEAAYLDARDLLQKALQLDASFALACVDLGATYGLMAVGGFERPTESWPIANDYNRRALRIDPHLGPAHFAVAGFELFYKWNWQAARRSWQEGTAAPDALIEPEYFRTWALGEWAFGRVDEAVRLARRARALDPLSPVFMMVLGDYLLHSNELDEAADLYEQAIAANAADPRSYFGLAEVRRAQRRFDDAIAAVRRGHAIVGDHDPRAVWMTAAGEEGYRAIERDTARRQLEALQRRAAVAYVSPLDVARAYAQLGDNERAFAQFEPAFADRATALVFLNVDRAWDGLRHDPRFRAAVARVGLPFA